MVHLSSKVSICHDPPLVLRKVFLTLQKSGQTTPGKKVHTYVLLKGQKQIVQLYLPKKRTKTLSNFYFLVFVQIWEIMQIREIMQIIQHFFPNMIIKNKILLILCKTKQLMICNKIK